MSRALSNIVAIILTTIVLVAASSMVLMNSKLVINALKPRIVVEPKVQCINILNSSVYLCTVRTSMSYCGTLKIVTMNGSYIINKCFSPEKPVIIVLNSKPIAIALGNRLFAVEVR